MMDPIETQFMASININHVIWSSPKPQARCEGGPTPTLVGATHSEVVTTVVHQSDRADKEDVMAESQVSPEMEHCVAHFSQALKDGVKSMEYLSHKVKEVCACLGLLVDPSAVDVIMRPWIPFFTPNQAVSG